MDLTQYKELIVRQEVEHLEAFTGFETVNRYSINSPEGERLLYAYEESGWAARLFLKRHRPLTLHVIDKEQRPLLTASRSFFWFFSHLHVSGGEGQRLGSLRRRFAIITRKFDIEDSSGRGIAEVQGSLRRPNTFIIRRRGSEVARITKRWSGAMREMFSDADTFQIQQEGLGIGQDLSLLILATAFAIDLDLFESR